MDRATGEVGAVIERPDASRRLALARDVVYFLEPGGLEACSDDGTSQWRVPREVFPTGSVSLLPLHRGLVVYLHDLTVMGFG